LSNFQYPPPEERRDRRLLHASLSIALLAMTGLLLQGGESFWRLPMALLMVGAVALSFILIHRAECAVSAGEAIAEARLEHLNQALPIGMFETDAWGGCTWANSTANNWACSARGLPGRGLLRAVAAADRRWLLDQWRVSRNSRTPFQAEHRLSTPEGGERWVLTVITRCKDDAGGRLAGFIGTCLDITEHRAFELDVLASQQRAASAEARLLAAIDAMDAGFSLYGPTDRLITANAQQRALFGPNAGDAEPGAEKRQLLASLHRALVSDADPEITGQWVERVLTRLTGTSVASNDAPQADADERLGGRWVRIEQRVTASGDSIMLCIDTTEARRREREIQRLAAVTSQSIDGLALLDRHSRIEWVNTAWERLTGYTIDEVRGLRGRDFLVGPLTDPAATRMITTSNDIGQPSRVEVQQYNKAGAPDWFEVSTQPLHGPDGAHLGYVQRRTAIGPRKAAEAKVETAIAQQHQAEQRLRESIDVMDAAYALFDADERLVICNAAHLNLIGATDLAQIAGMSKRSAFKCMYDRLKPPGNDQNVEPSRNADKIGWVEARLAEFRLSTVPLESRLGDRWFRTSHRRTLLGDTVVLRVDITSSHAREAQFEMLSMVASRTSNMVIITDVRGRIEWVNEAFSRVSGIPAEEALGRKPGTLLQGPDTDPATVAFMRERLAVGEGFQTELVNYTRDGRAYWLAIDVQPIRADNGQIVNYIAVESDVTERRAREQALHESEARNQTLASVVAQTNEAVLTKDLDNRITSFNRAAERLYRYSAGEAIGQLAHVLLAPHRSPVHVAAQLENLRTGSATTQVVSRRRRDGVMLDVELSSAPQFDLTGSLIGQVTVARDITRQLEAQQAIEQARVAAEQAQQAMSTFLENMTHELRTPMHAILSYARLGSERLSLGAPGKVEQYLGRIESSGERLLKLLNAVLDLSRLEAGRMPIEPKSDDLHRLVQTAIDDIAPLARARDIQVTLHEGAPLTAWLDPARIAQVMINLLGNAIKFSPTGSRVEVRLARVQALDGRPMVQVTVADNGTGIPEEERTSVFDKFVQSSKTRSGAGGTGLGLAICRELVLSHGGDIRAEANPGGGSLFLFTLPAHCPVPAEAGLDAGTDPAWGLSPLASKATAHTETQENP